MKDSLGNTIPKNALIIRHTEVSDFRNCRLSWYIHSQTGLNLMAVARSPKLSTGTIWHKGMEYHYSGRRLEDGILAGYREEMASLERRFGEDIYDPEQRQALEEGRDLALAVGAEYPGWAYAMGTYPCDELMSIIATEQRLTVPIIGPKGKKSRIWLAAKLDALAKYKGQLFVLEHKFLGGSVTDPGTLPIDLQMGLQLLVVSKAYPNERIGGAIYNLARKQRPGPRVKAPIFARYLVERSHYERRHLELQLYHDARHMRQCKHNIEEVYPNPQAFGGKCSWGCAARDVCEALQRGEDYAYLLDTMYVKRAKDIWQTLEEEGGE